MSQKKKLHPLSHRPFVGSVELIPLPPQFVEFIDASRLWAFPFSTLNRFVLEENPDHQNKKTLPPQQLILTYSDAVVTLRGWRLELLAGPLVAGRVARVHAEKHLGPLVIEEAWISEIHVVPHDSANLTVVHVVQTGTPASAKKI